MPIRRIHRKPSSSAESLKTRLLSEWQNPSEEEGEGLPVIIMEPEDKPQRLYVIWEDWADWDLEDRSEIIFDVYERIANSEEDVLAVTTAMGLTRGEAARLGIEYE